MEKSLVHVAAALLAAAVFGKEDVKLSVPVLNADGSITVDPAAKASNLQIWELHKIFYNGIVAAQADKTGAWPAPDGGKLPPVSPVAPVAPK